MNNSIRAIIDRALDDTEYPADAYSTAEHVDTQFDDDIEKLASALDFLGGNLNNIGTPEEKLLELYEFNKLANEGTAVVEGATGGAAAAGTEAAADAAAAGPKNPYKPKNALGMASGRHAAFAQGAEAGITHGMERGRLSADALQGVKNTWNSGAGGKAALIGTGLGVLGAGALLGGAMSKSSHFTGDLMYDDDESFLGAGFNPYAYEAYEMEKAASYGLSYEEYEMLKEAGVIDDIKEGFRSKALRDRMSDYADATARADLAREAIERNKDQYMRLQQSRKALLARGLDPNSPAIKQISDEMAALRESAKTSRGTLDAATSLADESKALNRAGRLGRSARSGVDAVGRGVGAVGRGVGAVGRGVASGVGAVGRGIASAGRATGEAISSTVGRTLERVSPVKPDMFNVGNVDVSPPSPTATREVVKEIAESGAGAAASPTATREAVKEIAEGGAGAASKPGFLSRHGGKLGIGAGVIGLGGLGYAAMRNRRRD